MGLGETRVYAEDGTALAGGIYYAKDPTLMTSVANVTVSGITAEPAVVATLTYSSGCTVVFKDWDGSVPGTAKVVSGGSAVPPADPTPKTEGTLFYRWSPADFSSITADLDVTAVYGPSLLDVASSEELSAALAGLPAAATMRLTADLDFEGTDYTAPVLTGTFDGNGHAITNLTTALFSKVAGSAVVTRNCVLTGLSNSVLGGLVGDAYAGTEITDCQFRVDDPSAVSLGNTPESAGGIVGSSHGAVLTRCYAEGFYRAQNGAQTAVRSALSAGRGEMPTST